MAFYVLFVNLFCFFLSLCKSAFMFSSRSSFPPGRVTALVRSSVTADDEADLKHFYFLTDATGRFVLVAVSKCRVELL